MSSRSKPASLTPFQREIIKRAQASLTLEGCSVSDEEALAIGQEFFGSGEAKIVEQTAAALRGRLSVLAASSPADAGLPGAASPSKERPVRSRLDPSLPKNSTRRS